VILGDETRRGSVWRGASGMSESLVVDRLRIATGPVFEIFRAVVAEGETYAYREPHSMPHGAVVEAPERARALLTVRSSHRKFGPSRPERFARGDGHFMVASAARDRRWAACASTHNVGEDQGYAAMQFNAVGRRTSTQ